MKVTEQLAAPGETPLRLQLAAEKLPPLTNRLVLALEGRLMGTNPRVPKTRAHAGRPAGQPVVRVIRGGLTWKVLTLPATPPAGPDASWFELVEATVERASERWLYAQEQAIRAARDRHGAPAAWARARTAWANYWALTTEAEELRRRAARRPART